MEDDMEKYFMASPYDLEHCRPELTTMPTDRRDSVLKPAQVVESFIRYGSRDTLTQTSDNMMMVMRNHRMVINTATDDIISQRVMLTRYPLADSKVLILRTPGIFGEVNKFAVTYCKRSPRVAAVLESPICRSIPGASLREVAGRHLDTLIDAYKENNLLQRGELMMCANVFMFVNAHNTKPFTHYTKDFQSHDVHKGIVFDTSSLEALREDIRSYVAILELSK